MYDAELELTFDPNPLVFGQPITKICIGNEALCPISVGEIVKVTASFTMLNDININILIMLAYIGTPRDSDGFVEAFGCQCHSRNSVYCADLSHGS
ncbi:2399_t:CDS:2 [Cetraspora pellucida]|uniref:2399_t:CDS:1 n=1 Tax=Cetraspora pellucida TaxID=1433469 RepID=A0A9N9CQR6_9GLOM|nr:2399_t:CDS:2 [Cetraspora pellucida]